MSMAALRAEPREVEPVERHGTVQMLLEAAQENTLTDAPAHQRRGHRHEHREHDDKTEQPEGGLLQPAARALGFVWHGAESQRGWPIIPWPGYRYGTTGPGGPVRETILV
ncbi:MAG: hypothetical protein IH804_03880 [Planctomycetes bacterium]|nr:hypothetical protein [Planctomycetota bacterium]